MKRTGIFFALAALVAASCVADASASTGLPLVFESNAGQAPREVSFVARGSDFTFFFAPKQSVIALPSRDGVRAIRVTLAGAREDAAVSAEAPIKGGTSFFLGGDRSAWHRSVATWHRVRVAGVYRGIDLVWYGRDGRLEYDFVVSAGADPSAIEIDLAGADSVKIDESGDLVLAVGTRELRWKKPDCHQDVDGARVAVAGRYRLLDGHRVGFELGDHDPARAVVIDPVLAYATYISPTALAAGDGFTNYGLAIAADEDGNAYVAGITESASFPVTGGTADTTRPGSVDVFVAKLTADGSDLEWATYLGGSGIEIENHESLGIAVAGNGSVYVAGSTQSTDFPTTAGAWRTTNQGGTDAFVTHLSADGSSLEYSTYVGGDGIDMAWDVAVNGAGEAFLCGQTNGGFPTTPGAYQTQSGFGAFVTKLVADGSDLAWSTAVGMNTGAAHSIALDPQSNVYITGSCESPHGQTAWPATDGAYQTMVKGSYDAFVTKLKADGSALVYSTYLGGTRTEDGRAIAVNAAGEAYVAGNTSSTNFPTAGSAFQTEFQSTPVPVDDAFVTRLNVSGTDLVFSSYLGGAETESATGIAIDGAGAAIVSGSTTSVNFPTTDDAFQETFDRGDNVLAAGWLTALSGSGELEYSTYVHPTTLNVLATSLIYGVAVDADGGVYVTGVSGPTFPTTEGAFQETTFNPSFGGPFAAKFDGIGAPASTTLCGDYTGDGKITAPDALGSLKAAVGTVVCALSVCDFNGDGKITAPDAQSTLRVAVGQHLTAKCPQA